eukprot:448254-Prorocentrum_minimum.AAC.1
MSGRFIRVIYQWDSTPSFCQGHFCPPDPSDQVPSRPPPDPLPTPSRPPLTRDPAHDPLPWLLQVQEVTSGSRFILAAWFTLSASHGSDLTGALAGLADRPTSAPGQTVQSQPHSHSHSRSQSQSASWSEQRRSGTDLSSDDAARRPAEAAGRPAGMVGTRESSASTPGGPGGTGLP